MVNARLKTRLVKAEASPGADRPGRFALLTGLRSLTDEELAARVREAGLSAVARYEADHGPLRPVYRPITLRDLTGPWSLPDREILAMLKADMESGDAPLTDDE